MPEQVERDFRRYLDCGILAHGFARARCGQCGHDFLIAFSCKGRGVCPSCNSRRMVATAAHLTDYVLPRLPVRQWVLAVPKRLRYFRTATPISKVLLCGCSCGWWSNACVRTARVQAPRHASVRWPSSTVSAPA